MGKTRTLQTSYTSGALDESLLGRLDTDIYQDGALELENVYVTPQGGVKRREGLSYVDSTTTNQAARLVPFEFSTEQTYILSFTPGEFKVYRTDQNSVQATVSSSPISALTADQIATMRWVQSADTLYLFHKDVQPIKITRTSHTSWTANSVTFSNVPPFAFGSLTTSTPAGSITPDVASGEVVVTGSGTNFTSSYEGQYINTPKSGRIFVKTVNSTTELEGVITQELEGTSAISSGDWELEEGYEDVISATRGWPRCAAFYRGRLYMGGLRSRPQTLLGSKVGLFENFDVGESLDDEAIDITIDDDRVNTIFDLFPGRGLQIFTNGGEFTLRSTSVNSVTPSNAFSLLNKETAHGSGPSDNVSGTAWPRPLSVDGATIFNESKGGVIRQFLFNDTEQSFNATNISILSQTLINDPVAMDVRRAIATNPNDYVYIVNSDGTAAILTTLREQSLLAISKMTTQGEIEDVAVSGRIAYFVVKRTINATTVRFIEKLDADTKLDASVVQTAGSPTDSWSNLGHLDGQEIRLLGDSFVLENETPSSGSVTTSESVSTLDAGLFFAAKIVHMPLDVIIQGQSWAGRYKNAVSVNINMLNSRYLVVKYEGTTQTPNFVFFGDNVLDEAATTFTGWKKVYIGGTRRDLKVEITQDEPLEFHVLGCHFEMRIT